MAVIRNILPPPQSQVIIIQINPSSSPLILLLSHLDPVHHRGLDPQHGEGDDASKNFIIEIKRRGAVALAATSSVPILAPTCL